MKLFLLKESRILKPLQAPLNDVQRESLLLRIFASPSGRKKRTIDNVDFSRLRECVYKRPFFLPNGEKYDRTFVRFNKTNSTLRLAFGYGDILRTFEYRYFLSDKFDIKVLGSIHPHQEQEKKGKGFKLRQLFNSNLLFDESCIYQLALADAYFWQSANECHKNLEVMETHPISQFANFMEFRTVTNNNPFGL